MSVYALRDPRSGVCRYVGQSNNPRVRFRQHTVRAHSDRLRGWCKELAAVGLVPAMEILATGTEAEWISRLTPDLNIISGRKSEKESINRCRTAATIRFPDSLLREIVEAADEREQSVNGFVIVEMREVMRKWREMKKGAGR